MARSKAHATTPTVKRPSLFVMSRASLAQPCFNQAEVGEGGVDGSIYACYILCVIKILWFPGFISSLQFTSQEFTLYPVALSCYTSFCGSPLPVCRDFADLLHWLCSCLALPTPGPQLPQSAKLKSANLVKIGRMTNLPNIISSDIYFRPCGVSGP